MEESGAGEIYRAGDGIGVEAMRALPAPGAHYLLPFGARSRFLFKMDFAEAEYISQLRSGVKGHFSYRESRLGDEAQDGGAGAGAGAADRGDSALGGRSV